MQLDNFEIVNGILKLYKGENTKVEIPSDVQVISSTAFENSKYIREITIPESVRKIQSFAFSPCKNLEYVKFGSNITEIPVGCCQGLTYLKKITVTENLKSIGSSAFKNCSSLCEIEILKSTSIYGETAVSNNPMNDVTVGLFAFNGCNLIGEKFINSNEKKEYPTTDNFEKSISERDSSNLKKEESKIKSFLKDIIEKKGSLKPGKLLSLKEQRNAEVEEINDSQKIPSLKEQKTSNNYSSDINLINTDYESNQDEDPISEENLEKDVELELEIDLEKNIEADLEKDVETDLEPELGPDLESKLATEKLKIPLQKTIETIEDNDHLCSLLGIEVEENKIFSDKNEMFYVDNSIDVLGLSVRSSNALKRSGVFMISKLLKLKYKEFNTIPNIGEKSKNEILNKTGNYIYTNYGEVFSTDEIIENVDIEFNGVKDSSALIEEYYVSDGYIFNKNLEKAIKDAEIESLNLSIRSYNALKRANISRITSLIMTTVDELDHVKNLGSKSKIEIMEKLIEYLENSQNQLTLTGSSFGKFLCSTNDIINLFEESPFSCYSQNEIISMLPEKIDVDSISSTLEEMIKKGTIKLEENGYALVYPSIKEYLSYEKNLNYGVDEKKYKEIFILENRIEGKSLEEVGTLFNVTRERIRQIEMRTMRRFHKENLIFEEDRYKNIFEKYAIDKAFYSEYINNIYLFNYLSIRYKKGTRNIEEILEDTSVPMKIRRLFEGYIYRNYLDCGNGVYVPLRKLELEEYVIEHYCKDEIYIDQFIEIYNNFLTEKGVKDENLFTTRSAISSRANRFSESMKVLWKQNQRMRFYDINARDYTDLLEAINLSKYQNIEISTSKLINENIEVMQRYDIRDEYELHNLLKKIHAEKENSEMKFSRMPNIYFGVFDRDGVVKEMLFKMAPVTMEDLAEALSNEYGIKKETIIMTWLPCISEYYNNGSYSVEYEEMPVEMMEEFNKYLPDDFYFFSELKEIYLSHFKGADPSLLSIFNLKRMGLSVNSNYVYKNFTSAEAYFDFLLTSSEVIDISEYSKKFTGLGAYSIRLTTLKNNLEIIEFEPYKYINIKRLEKLGIGKTKLRDFCDQVYSFIGDEVYFSIKSLRNTGFTSDLDALGFDDLFYASILKTDGRFSWQRIGNAIIFSTECKAFSSGDFFSQIVKRKSSIDIDDFVNELYNIYGSDIDKHSVIERLESTDIYYDKIMEKLYCDYETYFEEI